MASTNNEFNWDKDTWSIIGNLLSSEGYLVNHQLNSFNEFLDNGLENIISSYNPIKLDYEYVADHMFYKLSPTAKIDNIGNFDTIKDWVEYRGDPLLFEEELVKTISNLMIVKPNIKILDLSQHLSACNGEDVIKTDITNFIMNNIVIKKIPTNKHRYQLELRFSKHSLLPPVLNENNGSQKVLYPYEARLRNFTYSSNLNVELAFITRERFGEGLTKTREYKQIKISNLNLGALPIMLYSKACVLSKIGNLSKVDYNECEYDQGGYFIINGSEKVIITQERVAENTVYVFPASKQSKYSHVCEIKSLPDKRILTPKNIQIKMLIKSNLHGVIMKVSLPHIKTEVPLFIMFRILGVESDKDIIDYILASVAEEDRSVYYQLLYGSLHDSSEINTYEKAKDYLCRYVNMMGYNRDQSETVRREIYLADILTNDLLPHVGIDKKKKLYFLGHMVRTLLDVRLGFRAYDDRDSYQNKRLDTAGNLMANLFRQYFTKMIKDTKTQINKEYMSGSWKATNDFTQIINTANIYKIIKPSTITTGLKYALATGNWGLKNMANKQGIAQVLNRLTYNSTLSHLRRLNTPVEKTSKLIAPRKLHSTQFMIVCPAETPEGRPVGVVKNLALGAVVTIYSDVTPVMQILNTLDTTKIIDLEPTNMLGITKIFINGNWEYVTGEPNDIISELRSLRRKGIINIFISLDWNIEESLINIYTDAGRCSRPMFILKDNKFLITKNDIRGLVSGTSTINNLLIGSIPKITDALGENEVTEGVMEYIDVREVNRAMVAITGSKLNNTVNKVIKYRYTHCELHPALQMGVLASIIPYSDHNQSPRNTYQSAMGKQAMGVYATNYRKRMDTLSHLLCYPQKPIVNSRLLTYLPSSNLPCGINCIVAIASYSGYNQEDSVIMNQSAIDRGLFYSIFYRTYKDEEKKCQAGGIQVQEKFCLPDTTSTYGMKNKNYSKIDQSGMAIENAKVNSNDIIVGKVIPIKDESGNFKHKCCSTSLRPNETGFIDKVMVSRNGDGYKFVKITVRSNRKPGIGDKHSSRHGQKGTVGIVYNQADMPFTKEGIVPDIIMNPHAVPSRMTIGQVIESVTGKASIITGDFCDSTSFSNKNMEKMSDVLELMGFHRNGEEILYSGRTGDQLKVSIFIGNTYYQRLKHMVEDKIHSRATGPNVILTRQPAEGRSRDGGLRFGEMERDCMLSHGAAQFLKETLQDRSDNYRTYTCNSCGLIAIVNEEKNIYCCKGCQNYSDFSEVRIPYAMKLFVQELQCMSIGSRFVM